MSEGICYKEALKGLQKIYSNSTKEDIIEVLHEISTILSFALQKLKKLGVIEEFYDSLDFSMVMREHYNHLIKGVTRK